MDMRNECTLHQEERPGHALGVVKGEMRRMRTHARVRQTYGMAGIFGKGAE
jgi:hypothetical protein